MAGDLKTKHKDRSQEKAGNWPSQTNDDLARRRAVTVIARCQSAEPVKRNPGVSAVGALHRGMAQLVDQNRKKDDAYPDQDVNRVALLAGSSAESEQQRRDPKEGMDSDRKTEDPEVEVSLGRWWFADEHREERLRISD